MPKHYSVKERSAHRLILAREKAPKRVPKKHSRFGIILHADRVWKPLVTTPFPIQASVFYDEWSQGILTSKTLERHGKVRLANCTVTEKRPLPSPSLIFETSPLPLC